MKTRPVQVFLSYAPEDAALADELRKHLGSVRRQGAISVWEDREIAAGEEWTRVHAERLQSAQMIVLLVSASFLASERGYEDLDVALERRRTGEAQIVPIIVRPCDWKSSPIRQLQPLPRNQIPVTSWPIADAAWAEVTRELRSLLEFGADRFQPERAAAPTQIRAIDAIFRTVGQPDITFVEPAQYKALRRCLRTMGKGLVVEGPSGVGKTTLVSRALRDAEAAEPEWLFGQIEDDRRKLEERLTRGFVGHLIVDDFHRLDQALQARVADAMKIIADRDARNAKLTVIGINPVGDSLVSALRDLAGRFDVIAMGKQPDEKISELIQKGEAAANISFRRRQEFILAAGGSFFIAQQLCQEAALKADIEETAPSLTYVDVGFHDVVKKVVED
ncbi:MAG: TIR domain-containing protein, partial [Polyangiaceae bacterium]|nr:TIR domain-containing protein [Polyangiaceae bacterium]